MTIRLAIDIGREKASMPVYAYPMQYVCRGLELMLAGAPEEKIASLAINSPITVYDAKGKEIVRLKSWESFTLSKGQEVMCVEPKCKLYLVET